MSTRQTWWLVSLAAALGLYIYCFELPRKPAGHGVTSDLLMPGLQVAQVTRVELSVSNLTLRAEQKGDAWTLTSPVAYPARKANIEALVEACQRLSTKLVVGTREVQAQPRGLASFGLEPPMAILKFEQGAQRFELRIGMKAPVDNLLYVQLGGSREVQVVDAEFRNFLPRTVSDWRDLAFINLTGVPFNRLEMRPRNSGFEVMLTNQSWRMTWPIETRADSPQLNALVNQLREWPVLQFLTDDPRADIESLGLQPPEAELALGMGTNDAVVVQFGRSPTNNPGLVFARRLSHTNVVVVQRALLDQLRRPHTAFRDRRLLTFDPDAVSVITIQADDKFAIQRQVSNTWQITGATNFAGDPALVRNFLAGLAELDVVEFDSFVVTDFAKFGLNPPARLYSLKTAVTNSTGTVTNQLLMQLDLGSVIQATNGSLAKVYARRTDETAMYQLSLGDVQRLPRAGYQLRDRRLWNFTTNQVVAVTSIYKGKMSKMVRSPEGVWAMATPGMINTPAVEESVFRLGTLQAVAWTDRGAERAALYGITDTDHKLAIELLVAGKPQILVVAFGKRTGNYNVLASTMIDGQVIIFEFPQKLYDENVVQWLTLP